VLPLEFEFPDKPVTAEVVQANVLVPPVELAVN
jgi:hypothetical protein